MMILAVCPENWEWKPEFSKCYYYIPGSMTWNEANEMCMALDPEATLTSIHSQEENDYIFSLVIDPATWIGSTDEAQEGTWRWVN